MRIAGLIVAGGKGRRLGGNKPLRRFLDSTLIDAVVARAVAQVDVLALNVPSSDITHYREHFGERFDFVLDEEKGDIGPLAGILAGLAWAGAKENAWLATFPADTPFLPVNLVESLCKFAPVSAPVVVRDETGLQGLCALWPVVSRTALQEAIRLQGVRSLKDAFVHLGGRECRVSADRHAFFNVNTREDLARAEKIARDS